MFLDNFSSEQIVLDDLTTCHNKLEVLTHVTFYSNFFAESGFTPGDNVGLLMTNRVEFIEVLLAALQFGLKIFPLNWHLQGNEINQLLEPVGIRYVITETRLQNLVIDKCKVINIDDIQAENVTVDDVAPDASVGSIVLFTGGSTGLPKAVERSTKKTIGELVDYYRAVGKLFGLTGIGGHFVSGPLYHAAPLFFALYDLVLGAPLLIQPKFDVLQCWQLIEEREIKRCHFVATQMIKLLEYKPECFKYSELELILHGAAPTPVTVKKQMIEVFGPVLTEYWGGSESGIVCKVDSAEWFKHPQGVGKALPHYEVRVVDEKTAMVIGEGEVGLLQMRHESGMLPFRYLPDRNVSCTDGWFDLGDLGSISQGFVSLASRQKDKVISGGVNIYPAEVENFIRELAQVKDVVVCGVDDKTWGQKLIALLVIDGEQEKVLQKVEHHLRGLSGFKRPKQLYVVDSLARQATGKIRQKDLDALIEGFLAQSPLS